MGMPGNASTLIGMLLGLCAAFRVLQPLKPNSSLPIT